MAEAKLFERFKEQLPAEVRDKFDDYQSLPDAAFQRLLKGTLRSDEALKEIGIEEELMKGVKAAIAAVLEPPTEVKNDFGKVNLILSDKNNEEITTLINTLNGLTHEEFDALLEELHVEKSYLRLGGSRAIAITDLLQYLKTKSPNFIPDVLSVIPKIRINTTQQKRGNINNSSSSTRKIQQPPMIDARNTLDALINLSGDELNNVIKELGINPAYLSMGSARTMVAIEIVQAQQHNFQQIWNAILKVTN